MKPQKKRAAMSKKQNQELITHNPLAAGIHDALFEIHTQGKYIDLAAIINDASCWIAELHLQVKSLEAQIAKGTSAGYMRRDTSGLTYLHPPIKSEPPPVETDEWIATGKEG
jgi:hypothetical protein